MPDAGLPFDANCRRCDRLARHLDAVREAHPHYHAAPVPALGRKDARLLIVGLAPGMHGANRSGRPFTGDASGDLLFRVLFETGFANRAVSTGQGDGLLLRNCRITNVVKCLPPGNRPDASEISNCAPYLDGEIASLWHPGVRSPRVMVALGRIAHDALTAQSSIRPRPGFGHCRRHRLAHNLWLIDSYHPSRLNVNTGRLTAAMLRDVFDQARSTLGGSVPLDDKEGPA